MPAAAELTGRTFGRLLVVSPAPAPSGRTGLHWLCRCECGVACVLATSVLTRRRRPTRSCGCLAEEDHGALDLTGAVQPAPGRLTAVARAAPKPRRALWLCRCECGGTCNVTASAFRSLDRRSCGRCGRRKGTAHAQ